MLLNNLNVLSGDQICCMLNLVLLLLDLKLLTTFHQGQASFLHQGIFLYLCDKEVHQISTWVSLTENQKSNQLCMHLGHWFHPPRTYLVWAYPFLWLKFSSLFLVALFNWCLMVQRNEGGKIGWVGVKSSTCDGGYTGICIGSSP